MDRINKARELRRRYEAAIRATQKLIRVDELTEDELAEIMDIYDEYQAGHAYQVGDLLRYNGKLYKVIQAHTSQADWPPDLTPALYTVVGPAGVVPEWRQPQGAHDAYQTGDKVIHNGVVWTSTADNNIWEPGVYGWVQD